MGQASLERDPFGTDGEETVVDDESRKQQLLDALDDADCRAIIGAIDDGALTASEIADKCDLPLSTGYRKLDLLTEAGLLEERTRLRSSGKHTSEYVCLVEDVVVSLEDGGEIAIEVSRREPPGRRVVDAAAD